MISFKTRHDRITSGVILASVIAILCLGLIMAFVPKASAEGLTKGKRIAQLKIEEEIADAKKKITELTAKTDKYVWKATPDAVAPQALAKLSALAKVAGVQVTSFRPQRTVELAEATQLPMSVAVKGRFPEAFNFIRSIDASTKLAVSSIQMASGDEQPDQVAATVTVSAYLIQERKNVPSTPPKN
jgi:Tfp pilus assembly protein PilO